jgi:excisionase family DNA binding protein
MTLLTVKDIAARLHVKEKTVYAWASQAKIPSIRINGVRRFYESEIEAWLQNCRMTQTPRRLPSKMNNYPPSPKIDLDTLIARAKRDVYTSPPGKPDQ